MVLFGRQPAPDMTQPLSLGHDLPCWRHLHISEDTNTAVESTMRQSEERNQCRMSESPCSSDAAHAAVSDVIIAQPFVDGQECRVLLNDNDVSLWEINGPRRI